ncbi:hypothetical protein [Paenibacillus sp. FSL P2-0173]|uniref:hypothetical protein n=1 Tax=Paenibacillus sp. FSL P2-0173 TaxID=2921627 RepID=UPI0030F9EB06
MVNKEISSGDQNSWTASDKIHTDLLAAKVSVYNPCNFKCTGPNKTLTMGPTSLI